MIDSLENIITISKPVKATDHLFEFSICTLVTRKVEYEEMLRSFLEKGFTTNECEFLYIDNTNRCSYDAFSGINLFLQQAKGKYIIICHQDILLIDDDKKKLLNCINEISYHDPDWGILSNAGGINLKWIATHITQGNRNKIMEKKLPLKTMTVDENFIVIKNEANLVLSHNLSGFHLYGTDLCLIADVLGFNCYIIDFNLLHKSNGNANAGFYTIRKELMKKYRQAFRSRFLATTITRFYISGNRLQNNLINFQPILFLVRQYYKFFKPKRLYTIKRDKSYN